MSDGLLVVSSYSATKAPPGPAWARAETAYAGQHHLRLMRGVAAYRAAGSPCGPLDLRIVSARYGILAADQPIEPYDETFAGRPLAGIRRRGQELNIPARIRALLAAPRRLAIIALGDDYLHAAAFDEAVTLAAPTVVLCSRSRALTLRGASAMHLVLAGTPETQTFACGLAALKGEIVGRMLTTLAAQPALAAEPDPDRLAAAVVRLREA